jgi:hypothetical protein
MAALTTQPTNPQFLSPVGFDFRFRKLPNVNYFVQSVNLPGVQLGEAVLPSPFINIPIPGEHMMFGDLMLTFRVDENMENYIELFNWIQYLGFPESFNQSKQLYGKDGLKGLTGPQDVQRTGRVLGEGATSDATLTVLNSASNPNMSINFEDAFPISLTDLQFDTRATDIDFIEASVSFRFRQFKIFTISGSGNANTSVRIAG